METKKKKRGLDDYQLLLVICIFAALLWSWAGYGLCWTYFDQFLYAVYPIGFIGIAFVVKKFSLLSKIK
ncbi:hypothetical protein CCP3SC1AL1_2050004 [Gammaproteobacteria bacterium]